ncbi:EAL domain-containing protein [Citrobacter youngae]|uniref:EAL domain-containing protein n=1 Tax=Citrobacter sp. FDAARGOS_156 TaxID=1702170 RepID=UPI00115C7F40|nr:EAL domain-containing protein [Citrobacter sp. FDAARGOS_156]MBJ9205643.1 EAL domain-containing protein [Citrobacter sp. FDAARGOS_156]TRL60218.1 EAL domain-containing protein [Citrobacter youngae]
MTTSLPQAMSTEMEKKMISHLTHDLHHNIEQYRLEPFIDLSCNRIVSYEVLSKLKSHVNVEQWFASLSGRQQIDLLLEQIHCINESVADTCFYNLSVEGFLRLTSTDIEEIGLFNNISMEVMDSSVLKFLSRKEQYLFFKNTRRLKILGVKIWADDFGLEDLISLPVYHNQFDGIKVDHKELRTPHINNIIHIVKKMLGNIPVLIEGVESETDLDRSLRSGANFAQGYYWNKNNKIVA